MVDPVDLAMRQKSTGGTPVGLVRRVLEDGRRVLVIFLYLWALFSLFGLHRWTLLKGEGIMTEQLLAIVNAFVFAKVMFFAERYGFAGSFHDRPLVYPVLFKSVFVAVVLIVFYFIEETAIGLFKGRDIDDSIPSVGGGGASGLAAVAVIMFVVLIPCFAFRELSVAIGKDKLRELFFTPPELRAAADLDRTRCV